VFGAAGAGSPVSEPACAARAAGVGPPVLAPGAGFPRWLAPPVLEALVPPFADEPPGVWSRRCWNRRCHPLLTSHRCEKRRRWSRRCWSQNCRQSCCCCWSRCCRPGLRRPLPLAGRGIRPRAQLQGWHEEQVKKIIAMSRTESHSRTSLSRIQNSVSRRIGNPTAGNQQIST